MSAAGHVDDNMDFIEALQRVHDMKTNGPDGRTDMILGLTAAHRGVSIPGA